MYDASGGTVNSSHSVRDLQQQINLLSPAQFLALADNVGQIPNREDVRSLVERDAIFRVKANAIAYLVENRLEPLIVYRN